jgi:hypothetical protein
MLRNGTDPAAVAAITGVPRALIDLVAEDLDRPRPAPSGGTCPLDKADRGRYNHQTPTAKQSKRQQR